MGTKSDLRKLLKKKLSSITDQEHRELSLSVSANLKRLLDHLGVIQKHLVTGVFAPIQKEPHWDLLLDESFKKQTAYPAIAEKKMIYRLAQMDQLNVSQSFGVDIREPDELKALIVPEIIIVPGLGFSSDGKRLGRGKGFYDRYFEMNPAVKIGIAFEMQIEKDIPIDPHDVKMDFVVTDQQIYKIN